MNWILQNRRVTPNGSQKSANVPLQEMDVSQPNTQDHPQEGTPMERHTVCALTLMNTCGLSICTRTDRQTDTHTVCVLTVTAVRTSTDKLHTLFWLHIVTDVMKARTGVTNMQHAWREKMLQQTWMEDTNCEISVISLHTSQKSEAQNFMYQIIRTLSYMVVLKMQIRLATLKII
jgi:hypothetical protein